MALLEKEGLNETVSETALLNEWESEGVCNGVNVTLFVSVGMDVGEIDFEKVTSILNVIVCSMENDLDVLSSGDSDSVVDSVPVIVELSSQVIDCVADGTDDAEMEAERL